MSLTNLYFFVSLPTFQLTRVTWKVLPSATFLYKPQAVVTAVIHSSPRHMPLFCRIAQRVDSAFPLLIDLGRILPTLALVSMMMSFFKKMSLAEQTDVCFSSYKVYHPTTGDASVVKGPPPGVG